MFYVNIWRSAFFSQLFCAVTAKTLVIAAFVYSSVDCEELSVVNSDSPNAIDLEVTRVKKLG